MFGLGKKTREIVAPMDGTVIPVTQVSDPVFAERMLGDGFAVDPGTGVGVVDVVAPVSGRIAKLFKTLHAFAVVTDQGLEVFVHIGMDTVELGGEPFEQVASADDRVEAGQVVVRADIDAIRAAGRDPVTPVVFTNRKQVASLAVREGEVRAGDPACTVTPA